MWEKTGEQLSALVDGECDDAEVKLIARRLEGDDALRACWERYHLVGDTLKNNVPESIHPDFRRRVSRAIEAEPPLAPAPRAASSGRRHHRAWLKPAAGFALAASVAGIALFGLGSLQDPGGSATLQLATADSERGSGGRGAELESRISDYLVSHSEFASRSTVHGMLPYVRMVGHESQRR